MSQTKLIPQLQEWSSELWKEESFKGATKKFAQLLADHFGLFQCDYLQIVTAPQLELRKGAIRFPGISQTSDAVSRSLLQSLQPMLASEETQEGFSTLNIEGEQIHFAFLKEPNDQRGILIWKQPEITESSPTYRALKMDSESVTYALDFLIRQLQASSRWYRKLDESQSLLYQDDITGLFNHRYLEIALESEFRRHSRFLTPFSILFIDLDGFKNVNDIHGHLVGSRVLKEIGGVIKEAVRDVDTVIRYGGDEFVVLLIGATTASGILAAERIRRKIEQYQFASDSRDKIMLTASIGVASCPEHGKDKQGILRNADATMYESKRTGKNRVSIARAALAENSSEGVTLGK